VFGELYEVDDRLLKHLDWLESHPNLYTRIPTQCIMLDTEKTVDCEVYIVFNFNPQLLSLPFLSSYVDPGYDFVEENETLASELKR
jgi:gamma-glutamylcyclotransferase (GGCT)/AIG2-like uncharacterized protein YtfP